MPPPPLDPVFLIFFIMGMVFYVAAAFSVDFVNLRKIKASQE